MLAVAAVLGIVVSGLAIPFAGLLGFAAKDMSNSANDLPKQLTTESLPQRTQIVDQHGKPIATLYDQNRVNVQLNQISRTMVKALVAIEDYRFFQHGALDVKGTLRAFFKDQAAGGSVQGGSTLTQQLVKQTLVNQADTVAAQKAATADTFARKFRELRYAIALEKLHSKDWILQQYLNTVYFGDGAYGVQAAAQHYFGVNAKSLDLRQSALLAGLVQSPEALNPTSNPKGATQRRNTVLDRMAQLHAISQSTADKNKKMSLGLHVQKAANGCVSSSAPFFCDYVVSYLMKDKALGKTKKERQRVLWGGGLTIQTTMRGQFQHYATVAARTHVNQTDQAIGALAEVEPGTGNVIALAQSRPMGTHSRKGETFLNYAVPPAYGSAAGFQAGSTFKFFVMAAALQQGLPVTTSFYAPNEYDVSQGDYRTCHGPYRSTQMWPVHNSTGATDETMDMNIGAPESVNTYFAQLEKRTGLCQPYGLAKEMGLDLTKANQIPSFTLGVADENPLTMASAYATAASGGTWCAPRPVSAILDANGKVVKKYPTQCKRVMSQHTADSIDAVLHHVMEPGGFGANIMLDKEAAAKTGTNDSNMAVWFNGYTPAIAVSSVVAGVNLAGHQIPVPPVLHGVYYGTAHGSTVAGPMWYAALHPVQDLLPNKLFHQPPPGPLQAGLPHVVGASLDHAFKAIKAAGFTPQMAGMVDSAYARGEVAMLSKGTDGNVVYIYTSSGHGAPVAPPPPPVISHGGGGGGHGHGGGGHGGGGGGHGGGPGPGGPPHGGPPGHGGGPGH